MVGHLQKLWLKQENPKNKKTRKSKKKQEDKKKKKSTYGRGAMGAGGLSPHHTSFMESSGGSGGDQLQPGVEYWWDTYRTCSRRKKEKTKNKKTRKSKKKTYGRGAIQL